MQYKPKQFILHKHFFSKTYLKTNLLMRSRYLLHVDCGVASVWGWKGLKKCSHLRPAP